MNYQDDKVEFDEVEWCNGNSEKCRCADLPIFSSVVKNYVG